MLRKHPGRVLTIVAVIALIGLGLGYPGRNGDITGPMMYISGLGFITFLLSAFVFVVLASYTLATRKRRTGERA
ncbi:hypothetical protein ACWGQ5_52515 [Streptomyces sp. NPDC055722]